MRLVYGSESATFIDKLFCIYISLLPITLLYNFPALNIGIATVLLFVFVPHFLLHILVVKRGKAEFSVLLFFILYLYLSFRAEGNIRQVLVNIAVFLGLWAISKGALKEDTFREYLERFALINAILICIQTVSHYILKTNISFVAYSLLQSNYQETYLGVSSLDSLYRPCALFLEPAHFSQYCLFALISVLFTKKSKINIKRAILIMMGIVLTTSGMGILMSAFVIGWYVLLKRDNFSKHIKRILGWSVAAAVAFIVLLQIPFFQSALQRVFSSFEGYNAIQGRTGNWSEALSGMVGADRWFGYGGEHSYRWYLSGMPDTIYRFGIVGVAIQGLIFLYLVVKRTDNYVICCTVVFIALFCVAHLTGALTQMFYFAVIMTHVTNKSHKRVSLRELAREDQK